MSNRALKASRASGVAAPRLKYPGSLGSCLVFVCAVTIVSTALAALDLAPKKGFELVYIVRQTVAYLAVLSHVACQAGVLAPENI